MRTLLVAVLCLAMAVLAYFVGLYRDELSTVILVSWALAEGLLLIAVLAATQLGSQRR